MSNTNLEDVIVQLTETRNELSEEDLRLWDGLENERVSRIAGDDANKSLTLHVQDSVSGTERRLSTEVIHREQGDLDKLGLLNQLSQSMSAYRIKTDKEIEAERFARDILGINLDARITTAEASFNHKELKLYQDIQEVFTNLDGKYSSMDSRIKKYEDMLQDITMDSIKITMDNGEINMGAWTILSQAREWDLEILAKMRGFQEKTTEDVNQALEELQNQLPITENIINELMENLSESPLIAELRDALNEGIDNSSDLAVKLAQEKADRAREMIELAYANAQALAAEKTALAESLAAEAQARADEVQEEADRRIESIRQIRADLAQDVGELNDHVDSIREGAAADKAGILETVNNYKTEIKKDIAAVNTELLGALDGVHTLVTEVRDENGVTLNELTTYKASNDVAVAGVLSKITTNISDTAANASKITGLTSQLATTNTELGKVRNTSASALSKADTAVTANSALATRVDSLAAAITDLGEGAETSVDVYAFNALKAEVQTNAAGVTSLVEQVDALGTNYTNLTDGVEANTDAVSTLTVKQSEMNGDISQLSSDVTYLTSELGITNTALNTKASNQALSNLNTKLTTTDGKVAANTQQLTQLNSDLTTVRDGLETKASTEALNDLATEVVELEDGLAVNASAITSLKSEIDTELDKKATVTAVNGLTTKVEEVEGKTTTNANNLLALNTSVGNVVKGLANKLDASAISDYYTKSQTDDKASEIAAGKVEEFNASLVIGGANLYSGVNPIPMQYQTGSGMYLSNDASTSSRQLHRYLQEDWLDLQELSVGDDVVTSIEIMIPEDSAVNEHSFRLSTYRFGAASYLHSDWKKLKDFPRNTWVKVALPAGKYAGTSVTSPASINISFYLSSRDVGTSFKWRNLMMEKGTKASAFSESDKIVQNKIDANSTAIQNTNAEVLKVDGRVTATNQAQTLLEGRVQTVEGGVAKKADASALSSLDTRVGTVEGQYTTQASDITKLSNSLDTTNVNVGTAQTAAQNAMNAAGAKGKVIFGNTAPAVADRLVQNLWIDTTSNANTPKRWNGSAWVVVTDKVATDAAKAVSDLDTVVKTKADVTALNSLTTKVTDDAKKTTANTNSITELNSDIVKINNNLATKANASALSDMYTKNEVDDKAAEIAAGEVNKYNASLVIGGVNQLADSEAARSSSATTKREYLKYESSAHLKQFYDDNLDKDVTISFEISVPVEGYVQVYSSNNSAHSYSANTPRLAANTWTKVSITVKPKKHSSYDTYTVSTLEFYGTYDSGRIPTVRKVQLEAGNKATAWSPSPRDTQAALEANASAIQATNVEVVKVDDKTISNTNSIIKLNSDVTGVKNGLATKANTSALNDYYTKTETNDVATTAAAGEVSKYDANLVIGGSNLQDNADFKTTSLNRWAGIYGAVTSIAGGIQYKGTSVSAAARMEKTLTGLEVGQTYTLSVWAKSPVPLEFRGHVNATAVKNIMPEKHDPAVFQRYTCTFIPSVVTGAILRAYVPNTALTAVVIINKEKLEVGSKGTDWSPSSSDVQQSLDANATAIENTNAEVRKVDGRVTTESSRITTLTGRVTTAEKGLALKADTTALNNIYTKTESDAKATSLAAGEISKFSASLKVGTRNYASKGFMDGSAFTGYSGSVVQVTPNQNKSEMPVTNPTTDPFKLKITGGTNVLLTTPTISMRKGIKATLSFKIKNVGTNTAVFNFNGFAPYTFEKGAVSVNPNSEVEVVVFGEMRIDYDWIQFQFRNPTGNANGSYTDVTVLIADIMFSEGHTHTGWSEPMAVVMGELDVNAKAISTTNAEVERVDGVVKGHTTELSELTASVAGKASSDALAALTVRVKDTEGMTSTQAESLTSLTSTTNDLLDSVTIKDTRSTNQPPSWYLANYARRSVNEFKTQTAIGVGGFFGGTYCNLETKVYYSDLSGGHIIQTATSAVDPSSYVQRVSTSTTAWGAWSQPIKDLRDTLGTKASASAVQSLTTKVDSIDGVATSAAESTVTLKSRMDDAENTLQVQAKVVNGVKASYMVKMETNGVIGGFGLMQSTGALGQVVTSFGVNANSFFIGAPASKKQPFIVTTTNQVVNGVTYPAGTYIDVALIANATIGTAHIANASITNAKIKELDASKITTGTLDAGRIRVGSTSQFDSGYAPTDVLNDAKTYVDGNTGNLVNNPSVSGTKARWASGTVTNQNFLGTTIPVLTLTTSGNLQVTSDAIEVDPAKAYEVSVWVKKSAAVGSTYLGLNIKNAAGSNIGINSVNQSGVTSLSTNFYHWSVSSTANPLEWKKLVAYIMPAGTDPLDMKSVGNVTSNAFMLPNTRQLQMRVLNYYNNDTTTTAWFANPKIVEVDPNVVIAASKAQILADSKTQTFTAQPTTPYAKGDIYRNGSSIYVATTARASGSYVASDWTLVGDVTANNTAADSNKLGGTAAATVVNNAAKGIAVYNDVMSDLKITPVEKTSLNTEWTRIKAEYTNMLAHAASLAVSTTAFTTAYSALNSTSPTMTSILSSMTTTTTLTAAQRDALRTQFTNYYAQVTALNKAISDRVAANAKAYTDAIEIGGANLLYRSYDKDLWIRYGSPTITLASDSFIMDSSMLNTQTTFEGSGGSSTLKVYRQCANLEIGKTLTMGASVKNRGTKNITVNTAGLNAVSSLTVAPGKTERIVFTGTVTQAFVQFRILTVAAADAFKVDIIDLKIEYGDKATSWTPSPSEVNALIDGKSKTFLTTPTVPYNQGDIWKDGATTKVAVVSRSTGSYTAADWVLVGDVTANNKAADTGKVNGVAAATVVTNAANGAAVYADVMSDLKITPVEKTAINQEWNRIQKEYASLLAQAKALSITTTTFTSAYTGLSTTAPAMSTILSSMSTTTTLTAAQRDAYKTQYTTYYTQAVAITKAINDKIAANAKAQADAKSKTFTAQPVPPYTSGDLWKNGTTIRVCTVTRASGSYVAADWTLVGDVTSANTAANSNQLGGKASATVLGDITNAKSAADTANNQLALWKYPNSTYIDGGKIYTNSITANQINVTNLSSLSANLGTIKVDTANIADGAITTAKIENLQVDTLKIKDRAVTVPHFYVDTAPVSINNQRFDSFPKESSTGNWIIPTVSGLTLGGFTANADVLVMCDVKLTASLYAQEGNYRAIKQTILDMSNNVKRTAEAYRITARLLAGHYNTGLGGETGDAQIIGPVATDTHLDDSDGIGVSGSRLELGGTYTRRLKADSSGRIAISLWVSSYGSAHSVHRLTVTPRGSIVWYVQELKK